MTCKEDMRKMLRQRGTTGTSAEASSIIDQLIRHPRVMLSHTLLIYYSMSDEVPTQGLLDELVNKGKTVLLPRVISDTEMEVHRYTGKEDLRKGAFGIMEPTGTLFTDYERIDVAIVPGVAFDRDGHRLGRGKGYYDRFLSKVPLVYKIGVCFPSRLMDEVPADEYDILMDEIITANAQ